MMNHVESKRLYLLVFGALLLLTAVTIAASYVDLGPLSVAVALAIAVSKALLVALFFMHLRHSRPMTQVAVTAGVLWLAILLALTLGDYVSRGWLPAPAGW